MKCWLVCFLVLVLAACGGAPSKPAATAAAKPPGQQSQPAGGRTEPPPDAAPTTPVETAALKAEPTEPEIPVDDDPDQFMTAGEAALREVLGDPALIRRDGTAQVWQFRGDECTLDLFLYPVDGDGDGDGGGALAVKHIELRGEETQAERRACLARLIRARIVAADG